MASNQHGGKREGAGRKPAGPQPMRKVAVTLPPELIQQLKALGGGNLSAGIRKLAELAPNQGAFLIAPLALSRPPPH